MQIVVVAGETIRQEFVVKNSSSDAELSFVLSCNEIVGTPGALFYLLGEDELLEDINILKSYQCPVIINSVVNTLSTLPPGFSRINAWPGFLNRPVVELATNEVETVKPIMEKIGWDYSLVADEPGMIAARILVMIINEAYFALGDDVSTKTDIDIAMKLGTNYPYGPFEWSEKIGLKNVVQLLRKLSITDNRYTPAPLLIKEPGFNVAIIKH